MANTHSAVKRNRKALKRNARNNAVKTGLKTALKNARAAIASGDEAKAKEAIVAATKLYDRAASKGVIHKRAASRHVARIAHNASAKKAQPKAEPAKR